MEGWLYIWYMTEADTDRRASAYMVWYYRELQKAYRRFLPEETVGQQYREDMATDMFVPSLLDDVPVDTMRESIARIDEVLSLPSCAAMNEHYQSLMAGPKKKHPKSWYHLAGGPSNIRGLAHHLRAIAVYSEFYKRLSGVVHATSIIEGRFTVSDLDGTGGFKQLRLLSALPFVAQSSMSWSMRIYGHIVGKYVPGKSGELRRWHRVEVKDFLENKLPNLNIHYKSDDI